MVISVNSSSFSLEVLSLMCKGYSNKQPVCVLPPAEATEKTYVTAILKSLNVANRMQAAIAAQEYGLPGDVQ